MPQGHSKREADVSPQDSRRLPIALSGYRTHVRNPAGQPDKPAARELA
jgi:hypothetical protein